jgi:DNA uptake protein ComE-like DNA-binding protein
VDAALADALVAGRPYADMTQVDAVVGNKLTEEQKDVFYARVWKPLDLNAASEQEILLIPGIGERMADEFEEYRPYDGIERFRREMGKYVDATEVARLERYVMIP